MPTDPAWQGRADRFVRYDNEEIGLNADYKGGTANPRPFFGMGIFYIKLSFLMNYLNFYNERKEMYGGTIASIAKGSRGKNPGSG